MLCVPHYRGRNKSLPAVWNRTLAPRMSSSISVITVCLPFRRPVHRLPSDKDELIYVRKSSIRNPGDERLERVLCV
jgi:hypothetical protein